MWNVVKEAVIHGLEVVAKLPVSGIIKTGVFVGVAAFTVYVLVKRLMRQQQEANPETASSYSPVDDILRHNYVADPDAFDDMDPEARELCRKFNKSWRKHPKKASLKKSAKKPGKRSKVLTTSAIGMTDDLEAPLRKKKGKSRKQQLHDLLNQDFYEFDPTPEQQKNIHKQTEKMRSDPNIMDRIMKLQAEWKRAGLGNPMTQERIDQCARDLGLDVDDMDDNVSDAAHKAYPNLF